MEKEEDQEEEEEEEEEEEVKGLFKADPVRMNEYVVGWICGL